MEPTQKKVSVQALLALKEALTHIFWAKSDLRRFIEMTIEHTSVIGDIDWVANTKFESISQLIDRMNKRQDLFQNDILKLIEECVSFEDFSHLNKWDDSEEKIKKAKEAVSKLRNQTGSYFDLIEQNKKSEKAKAENKLKIQESLDYQKRLEALKNDFFVIATNTNMQQRGFQLEKFLKELFLFFDLDPKGSFKTSGEQIDGAFTFKNIDYLLEAKWQRNAINLQDLYGFCGKINSKFKTTCGLYISIDGFSSDCVKPNNQDTKALILMDGMCLTQVLEGRIKLTDMLYQKRRHAAHTGEIFHRISI